MSFHHRFVQSKPASVGVYFSTVCGLCRLLITHRKCTVRRVMKDKCSNFNVANILCLRPTNQNRIFGKKK